ncbi:hypothetical protein [Pelagibius sp. Alg239-R121]|uniref:hypothetical protein n=1 Tax=Pelagibius sp. Alg239-R121 TaxID=2993448 RepID=UPI0024A6D45A|nr:hypothetical protein [Pelagibius sp. Alg239-R121]
MPTLIRRLVREDWRFDRPLFQLDAQGFGHAVYRVSRGERRYSLIVFSHELAPEDRTDRVIAEAWDATFVLFDGDPTSGDIERLSQNAPKQEAGRFLASELVLSRANKSTRFFGHLVECLSQGRQPDRTMVVDVGYLMRTTAVYGNGKFGIADRAKIEARPELMGPFQAEMLTVYLFRCFTLDLVEHVARTRAPESFVELDPELRRFIGIGNSTGLGMAPFLVTHPILINNWVTVRETALARVRSLATVESHRLARFRSLLSRAIGHVEEWSVADERQMNRVLVLRGELQRLNEWADDEARFLSQALPWDWLYRQCEAELSTEAQEFLVSLLLEPYGDEVDGLTDCMNSDAVAKLQPAMTLAELRHLLETHYAWALRLNFDAPESQRQFWYVSEEKLEPRLGDRYAEPGADKEMPLAIGRDIQKLQAAVIDWIDAGGADESIAAFLLQVPGFRHVVRRVQTMARHPYGEIRDNLIDRSCLPIDLLRCKLSFFGASKFDPKSDRWTRITMYQGAPLPEDLTNGDDVLDPTDWCFPSLSPQVEETGGRQVIS